MAVVSLIGEEERSMVDEKGEKQEAGIHYDFVRKQLGEIKYTPAEK